MARRAAVKTATKKPAARAKGITKSQAEFVHRVHTGKMTKRQLAAASPKTQLGRKAPTDVAPGRATKAQATSKSYDWTPERDQQLREYFSQNRRTAVGAFARERVVPFHIVKQRAVILGLLAGKGKHLAAATPDPEHNARGYTKAEWTAAGYDQAKWATALDVTPERTPEPLIADVIAMLRGPDGDALLARIKAHPLAPRLKKSQTGPTAHQLAYQLGYADESAWYAAATAVAEADLAAALGTTTPVKKGKKTIAVACPQGDERLVIVHKGKRGFTLVEGASPEKVYGAGPNGLPICPQHDVEMIAAEPLAIAEAFRQARTAAAPQPLLFDTSKDFNADGALVALDALGEQIDALEGVLKAELLDVKKHRNDLETLKLSLRSGIKEFMKRKRAKAAAAVTRKDAAAVRTDAICGFERHTGTDCRLCRGVSRALAVANLDEVNGAYTDIESEAHRRAAAKANSIDPARLVDTEPRVVAMALEIAGLYGVSVDDVSTWTPADRLAALAWLEGDQTETPPEVLGMPHIAAAAGQDEQACLDCGARLVSVRAIEGDDSPTFPEGALVGAHCTRELTAAPVPLTEPERAAASA